MKFSEKQIQILEVAERLFADNGVAGTSVRDIAREAGVNVAMISYYFGSKEKMVEALFSHRSDYMKTQMEPLLKDTGLRPSEKLDRIVEAYVEKFWRNRRLHRTILREYGFRENKQLYKLIISSRKKQIRLLEKVIEQGQREKVFKANIDVPMLFAILSGVTKHILFARDFYRELYNLSGSAQQQDLQLTGRLTTHLKSVLKFVLHESAN